MASDPAPPRRRFQFRLRTLMIGVTLLGVGCWYITEQARIVRARQAGRGWFEPKIGIVFDDSKPLPQYFHVLFRNKTFPPSVPWMRRMLGDRAVFVFQFWRMTKWTDPKDLERVRELFPEAAITDTIEADGF
jgi:hypothetical protein